MILSRRVTVEALGDNEATLNIIRTGKRRSLRHIIRAHGVSLARLHDPVEQDGAAATYQYTGDHTRPDIFTKIAKGRTKGCRVRDTFK